MNALQKAIPQELELAAQIDPISADELRRYKVAIVFTWGVGIILLIIYILRMGFTEESKQPTLLLLPVMIIICWIGPFIMRKINLYKYTALVVWACGHTVLVLRALESGGVSSPAILWFIITPILITFVSSAKFGYFSFVMSILELIMIGLIHPDGFGGAPNHVDPFAYYTLVIVMAGISTLLISHYERFRIEHLSNQISREKMLSSSQKLASLGSLAGGLSHEFNSPLSVLRGRLDIINRQYDAGKLDDKIFKNSVKGMDNALNRMQSIITLMRTFTKDDYFIDKDQVNLNQVIRETMDQIGLKKKIDFALLQLPNQEAFINGNKDLLRQALFNIILNAVQALKEEQAPVLKISLTQNESGIVLKVQDNGKGLEEFHKERIWEPFFTTKSPGEGVGLGLTISEKLVRSHAGSIEIAEESGLTTFIISFPLG